MGSIRGGSTNHTTSKPTRPVIAWRGVVAFCAAFLAACGGGGGMATVATVVVTPMCTILAVTYAVDPNATFNPRNTSGLVADRTDPSLPGGFTRFRGITGKGNPTIGFRADVYGISEAWVQTPSGPVVVRAQAHPAGRPAFMDFEGSAWSINSQNTAVPAPATMVSWSPVFATGTANSGNEMDSPAAGGETVPQLMKVGNANQQLFACAGGRSDDDRVRTTLLYEVKIPAGSPATGGGKVFIQDLLSGDDRFVPNAPGPLIGPATPPTPTITNRPGNPVTYGSVQCAMTQFEDDVTTRELHMLTVSQGMLYHSLASNFSLATRESGGTFDRFNTVSPWGDVGQALGGNFGTIVAAAIAASRPTAISVFFVAESGGRYRLHHTVRFSNGSWRPADDVLALNGGTLNGTNFPFKVAAGSCPVLGSPQDSELVYAMWDEDRQINVGRVVSTPRQWAPGIQGIYSPMSNISSLSSPNSDPAVARGMSLAITGRPFSDNASVPPPP